MSHTQQRGWWIVKSQRGPEGKIIGRIHIHTREEAKEIARAIWPEFPGLRVRWWWWPTSEKYRKEAKKLPIHGVLMGRFVGLPRAPWHPPPWKPP